jgi:hypothetical protein
MIKFVVRYSAVVVLLLPFMAGAKCLIPGYKATYDLNAGGASGTLVQSLQLADNHPLRAMERRSRGRVDRDSQRCF